VESMFANRERPLPDEEFPFISATVVRGVPGRYPLYQLIGRRLFTLPQTLRALSPLTGGGFRPGSSPTKTALFYFIRVAMTGTTF